MLREPTHASAHTGLGGPRLETEAAAAPPLAHGAGVVPPVLYNSKTGPAAKTASETAYADATEPVKLPGRMYTVTLYDKAGNQIGASRSEPLYDDVDADLFYGQVGDDGRVHWQDDGVDLEFSFKVGAKLGDDGTPQGGIAVERWARQVAKGNLGAILVQIDGATTKPSATPPLYALDESGSTATQSAKQPAAIAGAVTGADSKHESTGAGQSPTTGDHGGGGPAEHGRRGTTSDRGHSGAGTGAQATRGGTSAEGNAKGSAAAGHDGSTKGTDFGTKYDANYFYDPSKADVGSDDLAPEGGVKGGMVGGKPHSTDEGIPQGGWFELVAVPRDIAPAVAAGIILLDADIAGLGVDIVKASVKLGRKAVGKGGALARVITKKLESYVERETAKLAQALSKDAAFASKTASEQAAILAEARAVITHEANQRLAAQLEKEVAEHKAAAVVDSKRSDGWAEEFAKQEEDYARAAQGARDSLPDVPNPKSPPPTNASKVESPALEGSPYHPTAVDNRVRPPYEPNLAHDPHSPLYNPNKSVEPPDAEAVYARALRDDDISTWYGLGEQGWYQFFSNRAGTVHFAGLIEKADVPKPVRNAFGQK